MVRILDKRQPEFFFGAWVIDLLPINLAQREMNARETRILVQKFLVVPDGLRILLLVGIALGLQHEHEFGVRVQTAELVDRLQRRGLVKSNQLIEDPGIARIFLEEDFVLLQSVGVAIQRAISLGFVVTSAPIVGVGLQLLVERIDGFIELIEAKVRKANVEVHFGILGGAVQHSLKHVD